MKKVNSQLLLVCALFILLVVLCYSWVSTEMFQNTPSVSTSVASNNNTNMNMNMNMNMNTSRGVEEHTVAPIIGSRYTKTDPSGYNGLSYFQDFTKHVNSNTLPRQ